MPSNAINTLNASDNARVHVGDFYSLGQRVDHCLADLRLTDPNDDKKAIESASGGLLKDSFRWILDTTTFQKWRSEQATRLLWLRGDHDRDKTMLLCFIIDELREKNRGVGYVSFFFCTHTSTSRRCATAVLRGLIYLLAHQEQSIISQIRKKYDTAGKAAFEDENAWIALSEIFTDILQELHPKPTLLIVDKVDECMTDLPLLLDFMVQTVVKYPQIKWIMSSRKKTLQFNDSRVGVILDVKKNNKHVLDWRRQAFEAKKVSLGFRHPETLEAACNFATALAGQGEYKLASELYYEIFQTRKETLGSKHPSTIQAASGVAFALAGRGEHKMASKWHNEVLEASKRGLNFD